MAIASKIRRLEAEPSEQSGDEVRSHRWSESAIALDRLFPLDVAMDCAPSMPDQVLLGALRDGRLRVVSPIVVRFSKEGQKVEAEAVVIDEFGFGDNPSEALADLQRATAELYLELDAKRDRLGSDLQRIWGALSEHIVRRPLP